ncbi:hypothetical protein ACKFKG_10400 [Phormidesmis sp. 146-35]
MAYLIPAIALSFLLTGFFVPQLGFTFSDIVGRLNALQTDLGFSEYIQPFANMTPPPAEIQALVEDLRDPTHNIEHAQG